MCDLQTFFKLFSFLTKTRYNKTGDYMETLKIYVNLESIKEIHHPFQRNTLHPTLVNFLYDECLGQERKTKIDIHISTKEKLEEEQKTYIRNLIHKHFKEEKKEIQLKKQISNHFYLFLLFLGFLFLLISFLANSEFLEEILLILGWIAIWECVENFLFSQSKECLKIRRYKHLSEARIYFQEETI